MLRATTDPAAPRRRSTQRPTAQPSRFKAPTLRQSASFTALARKMDTPPSGTKSPRSNRYSDEGDAAKKRLSGGGKKKGTFSSFMSNLVSSPRRPTISTPTNPMHVTHVSIDNETGEFTVRGPPARRAPAASAACAVRRACARPYPSIAQRPWFVLAR
jgi:p21-activated kinase 1